MDRVQAVLVDLSESEKRKLNKMLGENPLYPVLVDNGRYSHYQLAAGSYREYIRQDLYRPDKDLYVVGSVGRKRGEQKGRGVHQDVSEKVKERREKSRSLYQNFVDSTSRRKGMSGGVKMK